MISMMSFAELQTRNEPGSRCKPCSKRTYLRNNSLITSSSSCSDEASTSSEHEDEDFHSASKHPTAMALGRLFAPHDFDILESLGEGFFSYVHKVRVRSTGELLVLKVAKGGDTRRGEHTAICKEMAMLRRVSHQNVLGLKGVCIERSKYGWDVHLLTDYCSGGSLQRLILDHPRAMKWSERVSYAIDISSAMEYIHSKGIIHRDLTSMNVLLQNLPHVLSWSRAVVSDFGLASEIPKDAEKLLQVGTPYFMSPECLKDEFYDEHSDIFSFGIILCQLIARVDADPEAGLYRTNEFGLNYVLFASYCPSDTPIKLIELAFRCCLMNPAHRPSFSRIRRELLEMNILRLPSPNSFQRICDNAKISRSRSDAALRRVSCKTRASLRKMNTMKTHSINSVTEGVSISFDSSRISAVEQLASKFMSSSGTLNDFQNPFLSNERFRERKLVDPHRDPSRRSNETRDEEENHSFLRGIIRRCSSLPSGIEQMQPSSSEDDPIETYKEPIGPGGIPMAFRQYDLNFLREAKSMKRFPSRRSKMLNTKRDQRSTKEQENEQMDNQRVSSGSQRSDSNRSFDSSTNDISPRSQTFDCLLPTDDSNSVFNSKETQDVILLTNPTTPPFNGTTNCAII
ncbi:unnamed protein product, partial [Mesorhabditis belari]|uniref:dual-specificity kinase n=1 Tax=Mesorhabditis belari TaxID=2138241 RepID=A0AAF3EFD4_9BILA